MSGSGAKEFGANTVVICCSDHRLTMPIMELMKRLEVDLSRCALFLREGGVYCLLRGEKSIVDNFREDLSLTISSACERIILIGHADCRKWEINGFTGEDGIAVQERWLHDAKRMIDEDPEINLQKTVSWLLFMAHLNDQGQVIINELRLDH